MNRNHTSRTHISCICISSNSVCSDVRSIFHLHGDDSDDDDDDVVEEEEEEEENDEEDNSRRQVIETSGWICVWDE